MGCADFFGCFKPQPPKLEAARAEPCQPPDAAAPTWATGAPGTSNGPSYAPQAVDMQYRVTKPPTPVITRNYNAIIEVMDNPSDYDKEKPPPRIDWVIGLDFGTTYSGFAYARNHQDADIHVYYEWPLRVNERHYCKTLTGLYYKRAGPGPSWGYSARREHMDQKSIHDQGHYLTKFKLLLMPASARNDPVRASVIQPPPPLTRDTVITDYLRGIGGHALDVLRGHVGEAVFRKDSVQWCVTVPSIWDDSAKQKMRECMVSAGLVDAEEAVRVVLEPEAASFHCHEILRNDRTFNRGHVKLSVWDKILVVDVGGGTVDIVVQELMASGDHEFKVRELTESSGGYSGGTYVDELFMKFFSRKIGCLEEFLRTDFPSYQTKLLLDWEQIKCAFGHETISSSETMRIDLHHKLSPKWEDYERERGRTIADSSAVELTHQDLRSIFDPVVSEILELIAAQLRQVPDVKVMFVVGGFAGSPYLMQRIRARFSRVKHIVSPPSPGSAIVQGAVSLALHPDAVVSRIAKKTYGTSVTRPFDPALDPSGLMKITDGKKYCRSRFDVFVKKGTPVEVNNLCVAKGYVPHSPGQAHIMFDLFSSTEQEPRYAVASDTVTNEGGFVVDLPMNWSRDDRPEYEFSMYFGRSVIELKAEQNITQGGGQAARTMNVPVKYSSSL